MFDMGVLRLFASTAESFGSAAFRRRIVELIPYKPLQRLKRIADTLASRATKILAEKKQELQRKSDAAVPSEGKGKDIMSILRAF